MSSTVLRSVLSFGAAVLVLLGVIGAPVAAAPGTTVTSETVATIDGTTYVWQASSTDVRVETEKPISSSASVCIGPESGNATVACSAGNGTASVTLTVSKWPTEVTGPQNVYVNGTDGKTRVSERVVFVMTKDGDIDDDGLSNKEEVNGKTGFRTADTDDDGLNDGEEVNTHGTDPTKSDSDSDNLGDSLEVSTYNTNPTDPHTDSDNLKDGVEVNEYSTSPTNDDTDDDGLSDAAEIRTYNTNPNKADTDGDSLSDGAEINTHETNASKPDTDNDNLADAIEVEETNTNPNKPDTDSDGLKDGAEVNVHGTNPNKPDTDGDGTSDKVEIEQGTNPGEDTQPDTPISTSAAFALLGTTVLAVGGGYLWWRSRGGGAPATTDDGDDSDGAATVDQATAVSDTTGTNTSETASEPGPEPAGYDAPTTAGAKGGADDTEYDEPLTREDEIIAILEEAGGRLEQSTIVSETGWSKATVSRVLSSMADEGRVTKISLGRRNLITLPGYEPDGARSPFENPT
ncbi:helix-turn-helix domain-containing protein [Halogeometricum borinquense]|uniref:Helix-turn-helix domain-containing protein n=1 Tax=Halogeometricum borinquense TaxID=60847 RepID=A0A6C0UFN3_9EURY|nr:helix-turn-helix domain-containing protein [Halogeometricum borinquense]QIB74017.1 helix-turn-helix domain-containing protein [Halogeometricum borinquense]